MTDRMLMAVPSEDHSSFNYLFSIFNIYVYIFLFASLARLGGKIFDWPGLIGSGVIG